MFNQLRHAILAPRKLREAHLFLNEWKPSGVRIVLKDKAYWLEHGGVVYSLPYAVTPEPEHVPYMSVHLENHKWCLNLAKGPYTHRSLLQAWVRHYLPDALVLGFSDQDIIYPNEKTDRPLLKGPHTGLAVLHDNQFVYTTKTSAPLAIVAMDLRKKTLSLQAGETIYFPGNFGR